MAIVTINRSAPIPPVESVTLTVSPEMASALLSLIGPTSFADTTINGESLDLYALLVRAHERGDIPLRPRFVDSDGLPSLGRIVPRD